jgi:hypothetical protein
MTDKNTTLPSHETTDEMSIDTDRTPNRIETGTACFGSDWPGVFVRGDDAFAYLQALHFVLKKDRSEDEDLMSIVHESALARLARLMETSDARNAHEPQRLRPFRECSVPPMSVDAPFHDGMLDFMRAVREVILSQEVPGSTLVVTVSEGDEGWHRIAVSHELTFVVKVRPAAPYNGRQMVELRFQPGSYMEGATLAVERNAATVARLVYAN